jgi:MFS-type transporter involved in bile tolerance (Atg22 family)
MHIQRLATATAAGIHARHTITVAVLIASLFLAIFSAVSRTYFDTSIPPSAPIT